MAIWITISKGTNCAVSTSLSHCARRLWTGCSPSDGPAALYCQTKGWFKVVAPDNDNTFEDYDGSFAQSHANDESAKWYYANKKGVLYEGVITSINGKYYGC